MPERTVIDGVQYDEHGYQLDRFGRRVLQKMPHILAIIEKNKLEAKDREKQRLLNPVYKDEQEKQRSKDLSLLRTRLDSLREDIFHLKCHGQFLKDVTNLRTYENWVDEVDEQIAKLFAYRDHLVEMRHNREALTQQNEELILKKDHEITKILDEMDEVETRGRVTKPKTDSAMEKAKKFVSSLDQNVVKQFLTQDNITLEQFTQRIAATWAAANNGASK